MENLTVMLVTTTPLVFLTLFQGLRLIAAVRDERRSQHGRAPMSKTDLESHAKVLRWQGYQVNIAPDGLSATAERTLPRPSKQHSPNAANTSPSVLSQTAQRAVFS